MDEKGLDRGQKMTLMAMLIAGVTAIVVIAMVITALYLLTDRAQNITIIVERTCEPSPTPASPTTKVIDPEPPLVAEMLSTAVPPRIMELQVNEISFNRDMPLYEMGEQYRIEVPVYLQWMIRDLVEAYDLWEFERPLYGCIYVESRFRHDATAPSGKYRGYTQMSNYWKSDSATENGVNRLETEPRPSERDMYDERDNLLTCLELWLYAIKAYGIDVSTEQGIIDLMYYHNTGQFIKNVSWNYSDRVVAFANAMVEVQ